MASTTKRMTGDMMAVPAMITRLSPAAAVQTAR
jgi:hypothetical protein